MGIEGVSSTNTYWNPNTGQLTSNVENSKPTWEFLKENAIKVRPVEEFTQSFSNLPQRSNIDRKNNSIDFAAGTRIALDGGYSLVLSAEHGFELSGNVGDEKYFGEASAIRGAMNRLLRHTDPSWTGYMEDRMKDYSKWEANISQVLSRYGIDTSKDFTVNGMRFSRNENGILVSQRESDAKLAYEMQTLKNRTYEFADEHTRKLIEYRSNYYLKTVSEEVKDIWEETLQETGVNPFAENYTNTIAQLATEQDFATGGNDQIFGSTVESAIEATKRILERIDNPLEAVNEERKEGMEKEFYTTLLNKLEKL